MMSTVKLLSAAAMLAMIATPVSARSTHHHHHHHSHHHRHHHHVHYDSHWFSYNHNYGPGPWPGTFAYYDGPLRANCKQSAAAYRGQDGRAHPCN